VGQKQGDDLDWFLALWARVNALLLGAEFLLFFIVSVAEGIIRNFLAGWFLAHAFLFGAYYLWGRTGLVFRRDGKLSPVASLVAGGRIPAVALAGLVAWYFAGVRGVYGVAVGVAFFYLVFFLSAGWWFKTEGKTLRPPPSE